MVLVGGVLGGRVALALPGDAMDQHRTGDAGARRAQHRQELAHVVAVDRADVGKAELLEERAAAGHAGDEVAGAAGAGAERLGQGAGEALGDVLERGEGGVGVEAGEVVRHGADRRCDRHLVVVEDDEHPPALGAGVVHRLVGHAGADGAVADHRDDVAGRLAEVAGDGEAEAGGDRGRGMRGAEGVVGALGCAW